MNFSKIELKKSIKTEGDHNCVISDIRIKSFKKSSNPGLLIEFKNEKNESHFVHTAYVDNNPELLTIISLVDLRQDQLEDFDIKYLIGKKIGLKIGLRRNKETYDEFFIVTDYYKVIELNTPKPKNNDDLPEIDENGIVNF